MITKTQLGTPPSSAPKPNKPGESQKPEIDDPKTRMFKRRIEHQTKQLQRHQKQQGTYQEQMEKQEELKRSARRIARNFIKFAQPPEPAEDPNKNPANLYNQIKSTLNDLGLKSTMVWSRTTQIFLDKEKTVGGKDFKMYRINLRDNANIDKDTAGDLKDDRLESITEDKNDMVAFIWGPYTAPAEVTTTPGEAPGTE